MLSTVLGLLLVLHTNACTRSTKRDITGQPYTLASGDSTALCPVHDPAIAQEGLLKDMPPATF